MKLATHAFFFCCRFGRNQGAPQTPSSITDLFNWYASDSPFSSHYFMAPPSPNVLSWWFQSWNRLCFTVLGPSKSQRISKLYCWIKNYSAFAECVYLPIGRVSSGRVCASSRRSRLVSLLLDQNLWTLYFLGKYRHFNESNTSCPAGLFYMEKVFPQSCRRGFVLKTAKTFF